MVAGRTNEREPSDLGRLDRAAGGEPRRLPGRRPAQRVAVEPRLLVERCDRLDVSRVVHGLDARAGRPASVSGGAAERREEDLEPLGALGMVVVARRVQVGHRGMRDQIDAASSSRPASRPRPSASAPAAPARQSGSRSGSAGSGAVGSSVAT